MALILRPWFHIRWKILDWGPRLGPKGPQKVKILKFLFFNVEPSKLNIALILGPWFHIFWKILDWGPRLGPKGPRKVKILKFLLLNIESSKFDIALILGPWFHICWKNLDWRPWGPLKGQNFEIFVFERRTFKIWYSTNFGALISYLLKNFG